uniref:Prospero domain-containing protein n=1 Tax=Caenorhabditis tropicalis TaxID=1561998 RepID=A0A1I7URH8_9PELO
MTTCVEQENLDENEEIEAMKVENDVAQEEQDEIDAEYNNGINGEPDEEEERTTPDSNSSSSASKRKSFLPQKIGEELGIDFEGETEQINVSVGGIEEPEDVAEEAETKDLSAIQAQLQNGNSMADHQRRFYAAFIEQQKKQLVAAQMMQLSKVNIEGLLSALKGEVLTNFAKNMEKVVKDWIADEVSKQETSGPNVLPAPPPPPPFPHIFPANPLFHMVPPHHPMPGGGIFPPNFNPLHAFNALRRNLQDVDSSSEVKRKRAKLDIKKEDVASSRASPLSASASPPLGRFFPAPTMVGNHYGGMHFGDREDSPTNSDELSDCGYEGSGSSSMLTPMHLRKAKLMFFYTRYPNSNLLKSYFPDIRFNKNNTAQLVKWFSNFREFYYIQMEKFARQALAEGITDRSEIFVSKDSELFKVLNTHYNRNNHIKAPDRLVLVVQETLREFYDAIKQGKDVEPSWKKTIYKKFQVINRLDDQIPDFFKEPNFLERLET